MENNDQKYDEAKQYPFRTKEELDAFIKLLLLDDEDFQSIIDAEKVPSSEA